MANIHRFRHADPKRVRSFAVDSATVIEVGDAVFQTVDDIRNAALFAYVTGSLDHTQANFRRDFMGIAMTASANGETDPVQVAQAGTFEMDIVSGTYEIGDRVGMEDNAAGDTLLDQTVIAIGENGGYGEIGKIARRYSAATTRAMVELEVEALRAQLPVLIWLFNGSTTTAGALVTEWVCQFPFKLMAVHFIVTAAYTGTDVITVEKGTTDLDDTVSVTGALGVVGRTVMNDATGDDIYGAGDLLSLDTDGASTAGSAWIGVEVVPFLHES